MDKDFRFLMCCGHQIVRFVSCIGFDDLLFKYDSMLYINVAFSSKNNNTDAALKFPF